MKTCDYCPSEALYHTQEPADVCLGCITRDPAIRVPVEKLVEKYRISHPDAAESVMRLWAKEMAAEMLVEMGIFTKIEK